jgi:hypothetical protein
MLKGMANSWTQPFLSRWFKTRTTVEKQSLIFKTDFPAHGFRSSPIPSGYVKIAIENGHL